MTRAIGTGVKARPVMLSAKSMYPLLSGPSHGSLCVLEFALLSLPALPTPLPALMPIHPS